VYQNQTKVRHKEVLCLTGDTQEVVVYQIFDFAVGLAAFVPVSTARRCGPVLSLLGRTRNRIGTEPVVNCRNRGH